MSEGPGCWLASDGKWHPPEPIATAPPPARHHFGADIESITGPEDGRIGCFAIFALGALVIIVVVVIAAVLGGKSGGNIRVSVQRVGALDGDTVRIYLNWQNNGSSAASASCVINTTVNNQFGDQVNIEVNSTSTNGDVKAHGSQLLYQDVGVNSGDAPNVTMGDVKLTNC
jgi:hypothetical protein